jgi:tRNA(Arg) A34 adenosine deaminase TadA
MAILEIAAPAWIADLVDAKRLYVPVEERMRLAIALARANVEHASGGPFGAAVFEERTGALISVGVNQVVPQNNSMLHAEVVALMLAEARLGSYTLDAEGLERHQLVASSDPCAMCVGAVVWSGVRSIVTGAALDDARALGFDEGPATLDSSRYLEERGIVVTRGVLRDEARGVLQLYRDRGGVIYNRRGDG